ncbi:hypothetical protein [Chromobacterium sphagni]|uniref:hypothetical protein n=1 Tax=Chromobacterium sphagni TaxID=1903179 RepID=UPI00195BAD3E|nr:hypothetical protein [Chromobacterium sphagni]
MSSIPLARPLGLTLAIVMVGLNLRPGLAAIGPLLEPIRAATGIRFSEAALLTTLPIAAMGAGAFAGHRLEALLGARLGVLLALRMILLSCALRCWPPATPACSPPRCWPAAASRWRKRCCPA